MSMKFTQQWIYDYIILIFRSTGKIFESLPMTATMLLMSSQCSVLSNGFLFKHAALRHFFCFSAILWKLLSIFIWLFGWPDAFPLRANLLEIRLSPHRLGRVETELMRNTDSCSRASVDRRHKRVSLEADSTVWDIMRLSRSHCQHLIVTDECLSWIPNICKDTFCLLCLLWHGALQHLERPHRRLPNRDLSSLLLWQWSLPFRGLNMLKLLGV